VQLPKRPTHLLDGLPCRTCRHPLPPLSTPVTALAKSIRRNGGSISPLWTFSEEIPEYRRTALNAVPSFDAIIQRLASCPIEDFWAQPRDSPPCVGTHRAVFRLRASEEDYDAFFNAPVGYRAQYCLGSDNGRSQNRRVLDALEPRLVAFYRVRPTAGCSEHWLRASLRGFDAKIWIYEAEVAKAEGAHILYEPWLAKLRAAKFGSPTGTGFARVGGDRFACTVGTVAGGQRRLGLFRRDGMSRP
jgi:hypothetical protein